MEKKEIQEWRDRLIKMFGIYHSDGQEYITCPLCGINLDELAKHMIEELDKAREEGKLEYILSLGWQDTNNEYVKEVLEDADRIANELSKLKDNK